MNAYKPVVRRYASFELSIGNTIEMFWYKHGRKKQQACGAHKNQKYVSNICGFFKNPH
jgi:hypothetical protein